VSRSEVDDVNIISHASSVPMSSLILMHELDTMELTGLDNRSQRL
jgi:hypothetical protein